MSERCGYRKDSCSDTGATIKGIWTCSKHQYADELQALRDERDRLARAIVWALGYTDFRAREQGEGAYWWRTELRLRAKLTGEQIDVILAALTPATTKT